MIDTRTSIRGALRQRQRGFIINPFSFGAPPPAGNLYDAIMAAGPFAYYQLGEAGTPTQYDDSSGNGYHLGNIVPTVTAGSTALVSPGTSADFDGSGYISSGNDEFGAAQAAAFDGDTAFSFVFVIRLDTLSTEAVPIHLGNASVGGSQGLFMQLRTDGVARLQFITGSGYQLLDTPSSTITTGVTYIVHARRAVGGACSIFVNGVSKATSTLGGLIGMDATTSSGGQRIMIGALNLATPDQEVNGRIQHAAVFANSLSDAQIAAQVAASGL